MSDAMYRCLQILYKIVLSAIFNSPFLNEQLVVQGAESFFFVHIWIARYFRN